MEHDILKVSRRGESILLTVNRPKALNALNIEVFNRLYWFFSEGYREYQPFTAVVLTGEGEKAFAAGADISEFQGMQAAQGAALSRRGHATFFLIERFHVPVIAAVNGFALGGGCELAMACHLRVASSKARFGQPEVNLGLIPGYGATQRLTQLIGKGRALELLLTGEFIDARRALEIGLANVVTEPDQLLETCDALVEKLAAKAPLALERTIAVVNAAYEPGMDGYTQEVSSFAALMETHDFVEGTQAFIEKRQARFTRS